LTGVCSLLITGALTVILSREIRLPDNGKGRVAWIPSKAKPSTPTTLDPSSQVVGVRTEEPARRSGEWQHHSLSPLLPENGREETAHSPSIGPPSPDADQLRYPEENPAAIEIAARQISEPTNIRENLRQAASPTPPQTLLNEPRQTAPSPAVPLPASCAGDFGTSVKFVKDPQDAFRLAGEEKKIVFLLHLSGNFEDANLT
jgi:hypothetical protein